MKRLLMSVLISCVFALQFTVRADNDKPILVSQLPEISQKFLKEHFYDAKISLTKMENELFEKSYDVIFTNGNKVEFDRKGEWSEIKCTYSSVPDKIVPEAILKMVKENYPDAKILSIERDKIDYEVKLSNKWELTFDKKFNLIDIDD